MLNELEVVEMLCRGVDPRTGEVMNTPRNPGIDELRLKFLKALKALDRKPGDNTNSIKRFQPDSEFPNKGKKWEPDDIIKLKASWDEGLTLDSMTSHFGRTAGALCAKLADVCESGDRDVVMRLNITRGGKYGSEFSSSNVTEDAKK